LSSSRVLVAPGLRTAPRAGWRSGVATAAAVVVGQPGLWLIGSLGFLLRGGIVLLVLPIVVLPTVVEARLLLGTNLGSSGLTAAFVGQLAQLAGLLVVPLMLVLLAIAYLEMVAFERLVADPETGAVGRQLAPARLSRSQRRHLLGRLLGVQVAALVVLGLSCVPLVLATGAVVTDEILRPSLPAVSIYNRVLAGVRDPLIVAGGGLIVAELLSAIATRGLLIGGFGLAGARRAELRPAERLSAVVRTLATAVVGWLVMLGVLLPSLWSQQQAWNAARATLLSASAGDPQALVSMLIVAIVLSSTFVAATVLLGAVAAFRGALWSTLALHASVDA
jgi:hypothetical protein